MPTPHEGLSGLRLLLAFPRSAAGHDPLFSALRPVWRTAGLQVEHLAVDGDTADAVLERRYLETVRDQDPHSLIIGGFSLGARIAVQVAARVQPLGMLCFGYPFHVRGDARNSPGLEVLRLLHTPTLIVQGTRDPHGDRGQVRGYGPLPGCVRVHWLDDGNHRLRPRERSPHTEAEHLRNAAAAGLDFLHTLPTIAG